MTARNQTLSLLCTLLASGLGSGRSPIAPGTAGTIAFWLFSLVLFVVYPPALQAGAPVTALILCALGYVTTKVAIQGLRTEDPQWIVIDEWAGLAVAYCFISTDTFSFASSLLALGLFRIFDIAKFWPMSKLESLPGAAGIMADDIAAGLLAGLTLQVLCFSSVLCL